MMDRDIAIDNVCAWEGDVECWGRRNIEAIASKHQSQKEISC